jgi:hypothetical protein
MGRVALPGHGSGCSAAAVRRRVGALVAFAVALVGCGSAVTSEADFSADDAVLCRAIGADLVHIRYEGDRGSYVVTRPGVDLAAAQGSLGITEDARLTLHALGWDDDALGELAAPGELSPEVVALLESRPSCLDELRMQDD